MHSRLSISSRFLTATAGLFTLGAGTACFASIPPEFPETRPVFTGIRASGMGGAYAAIAEDVSALEHNPAGLAQILRTEVSAGLERLSVDEKTTYLGNQESTDLTANRLQHLGFAYPLPTWQGSLVLAASYQRWVPLDREYSRAGVGRPGAGEGILDERELISESGVIGAWQAGLAWDFSRTVLLGVSASLLSGSYDRLSRFDFAADDCEVADSDGFRTVQCSDARKFDSSADYFGYTGTLGMLYRGERGIRAGFVLQLPQHYNIDGTATDDIYFTTVEDDPEVLEDVLDTYKFEDELDLPARLTGALSYENRALTLSAQATMTNWKDVSDSFGSVRLNGRDFAYRSTTSFRLGAEYRLRGTPVALRAGFAREPLPYEFIAVDVFEGVADTPVSEDTQQYLTAGLGYELDPNLHLDATYMRGSFSRSGELVSAGDIRTTIEETTENRFLIGVTFFQTRM